MLTKNQLNQLRNEITILKDYSNSLYIKKNTVCNFFDSFMKYIDNTYNFNNMDFYELLERHDNIDELYQYYCDSCIDGYDPLLQDDIVGIKNTSVYTGYVIYEIDNYYDSVVSAYLYSSGIKKRTTNKLYYSIKKDDYFFIKNGKRQYMKDFQKIN